MNFPSFRIGEKLLILIDWNDWIVLSKCLLPDKSHFAPVNNSHYGNIQSIVLLYGIKKAYNNNDIKAYKNDTKEQKR